MERRNVTHLNCQLQRSVRKLYFLCNICVIVLVLCPDSFKVYSTALFAGAALASQRWDGLEQPQTCLCELFSKGQYYS